MNRKLTKIIDTLILTVSIIALLPAVAICWLSEKLGGSHDSPYTQENDYYDL